MSVPHLGGAGAASPQARRRRVLRGALLGCVLPALSLGGVPMLLATFLPRLWAEEYGVSLAALARGALLASLADALAAPIIGGLSDRARRAGAPRGALVLAGSLPMAALTVAVFSPPPPGLGSSGLACWCLAGISALHVAKTAVEIPLYALGTELTSDHDVRNSMVAAREATMVLGSLLAALLPSVLGGAGGQRAALSRTGACFGAVAAATGAACALCTAGAGGRARAVHPAAPGGARPLHTARELLGGREGASARALVLAQGLSALGGAANAAAFAFFVSHVLFPAGRGVPSFDPAGPLLGAYVLASVLCLPLWVRLGARLEKRTALVAALLLQGTSFLGIFAFCGPSRGAAGAHRAFALFGLLAGCAAGAPLVFPASMRADLCTQVAWATGERREGAIEGIFALVTRCCQTLGAVLALAALRAGGFQEGLDPGAEQPHGARTALHFVYSGLPGALIILAALPLTLGYSLDRARLKQCAASSQRSLP